MKKTLLITIDFHPSTGGVANYLVGLAVNLSYKDLVVLAPQVKFFFDNQFKFRIYRRNLFWCIWPKWLPMIWQIYKITKKEGIKMLWAAQPLPVGTAVYLISKILKISYIVNTHGMDVAGPVSQKGRKLKILKKVLAGAKWVTVNSEYTKNLALKMGVEEDKIVKIYPCPKISNFKFQISKIIEKYDLGDKKVLLSVGRLVERKGFDKVIEALPKVLEKVPNLIYLIVGDGKYKDNLLRLIKELNLSQNVALEGFTPDKSLPAYFGVSSAFIMPAREGNRGDVEGFGLVFLEANFYGLPVIAGRSGGQTEAVLDEETGLIVDPENTTEIANAIIRLMTDEVLAKKLGDRGRDRVGKEFKWKNEAEKLEKLLI